MRASVVMLLAVILYVIVRWSRNEPAVTLPVLLGGGAVILVIGMMDTGRTEEIAKGFAWLVFIVAAYNAIPALSGAITSANKQQAAAGPHPVVS